jgi:hypothetical protein
MDGNYYSGSFSWPAAFVGTIICLLCFMAEKPTEFEEVWPGVEGISVKFKGRRVTISDGVVATYPGRIISLKKTDFEIPAEAEDASFSSVVCGDRTDGGSARLYTIAADADGYLHLLCGSKNILPGKPPVVPGQLTALINVLAPPSNQSLETQDFQPLVTGLRSWVSLF